MRINSSVQMKRSSPAVRNPVLFILILLLCNSFPLHAQKSSSHVRISLLTCGQGEEIYSTFGHTAISVIDSVNKTDLVYNYGTFDFEAPGFIYNFVKGKLNYFLSVSTFDDFMAQYQYEKRKVWEQELILSDEQKIKMNDFLLWNALPENKNYLYDFIKDNCTTRVRDIIAKNCGDSLIFDKLSTPKDISYRDGINKYSGNLDWLNFGMNILIGSRTDTKAADHRYYFLPDYVLQGMEQAKVNGQAVAKPVKLIYDPMSVVVSPSGIFTPTIIFASLAILLIFLSYYETNWIKKILSLFDMVFFISLGLLGVLLLFMWFGTDHYWCKDNLHLIWALPSHLLFIFLRNKPVGKKYFAIISLITFLFIIFHFLLPQQFQLPVLCIALISAVRARALSR